MVLAVVALLLQTPAIPQNPASPEATVQSHSSGSPSEAAPAPAPQQTALTASTNSHSVSPGPVAPILIPEFQVTGATFAPGRLTPELLSPASSGSASADVAQHTSPGSTVLAAAEPAAIKARAEQRRYRMWLTLSLAQHGAAAFDAWSTRGAISRGQARELNPMLRPFAGNASLYAAIQVGPILLDYLGRRLMNSRSGRARQAWWVPQAVGTALSLVSGVHNLTVNSEEP